MKYIGTIKRKMDFNNTGIDWSKVDKVILNSNKIMLTTHENPDGDGLGAECGIYYHLKELGKDIRIINYSPRFICFILDSHFSLYIIISPKKSNIIKI